MVDDRDKQEKKNQDSSHHTEGVKEFYYGGSAQSNINNFTGCISYAYISRYIHTHRYSYSIESNLSVCLKMAPLSSAAILAVLIRLVFFLVLFMFFCLLYCLWCTRAKTIWQQYLNNITVLSWSCSPHLEHLTILCHPFNLPQKFTAVIISTVYITPQANNKKTLSDRHDMLYGYQAKHPDATLIMAGDFNTARLKHVMLNFRQHVTCPTRWDNTLDHCSQSVQGQLQSHLPSSFREIGQYWHITRIRISHKTSPESFSDMRGQTWTAQSEATLQDTHCDKH